MSTPEEIAETLYSKISDLYSGVPIPHLQGLRSRFGTRLNSQTRQILGELVFLDVMQILDPKCQFFDTSDLVRYVVEVALELRMGQTSSAEVLEAVGWYVSWQASCVRPDVR